MFAKDQRNSSSTCCLKENSKRKEGGRSVPMLLPHPHPFFSQRAFCSEKLKDSDGRSQIQDRKGRIVGTQTLDTFLLMNF
jgi:hypothetical protein